jgi:hypothetical protein
MGSLAGVARVFAALEGMIFYPILHFLMGWIV